MRSLRIFLPAVLAVAVSVLPATAAGNVAYARPVSGITVDGDLADWPGDAIEYPIAITGAIYGGESDLLGQDLLGNPDLSATFRVGYDPDEDLVYVGIRVRDDQLVTGSGWTQTDACEVYLGGSGDVRQYYLVPGTGSYMGDGENPGLMGAKLSTTRTRGAWQRQGDVTTYEWAVEAFGQEGSRVDLQPGAVLPFDVAIADLDGSGDPSSWVTWGPYVVQKFASADRVGSLALLAPGAALTPLAGSVGLSGLTVQALDGDHVVGAAPVGPDGRFQMQLPPGNYRLAVAGDGTYEVGGTSVQARTGTGEVILHTALYRVQPPEPQVTTTGSSRSYYESETYQETERWKSVMTSIVWAVFLAGVFTFLIFRQVLQTRTKQAAIQAGQALPEPLPSDPRKPALVLIALGVGFAIAIATTLSYIPDPDAPAPLAVAIWGLVPALLGAALWAYRGLSETAGG